MCSVPTNGRKVTRAIWTVEIDRAAVAVTGVGCPGDEAVTVMVPVPAATPVIWPVLVLIVAAPAGVVTNDQVTVRPVAASVCPPLDTSVTDGCVICPTVTLGLLGAIDAVATAAKVTVTVDVPAGVEPPVPWPGADAVIVTLPGTLAVTSPA